MHPIFFQIGNFKLYTYGLFVALGFITAVWISKAIAKPRGVSHQTITDLFFVILLSALVGARLLYVIVNLGEYKNNLIDVFKIWNGGLVFFGGFIAAVLAGIVFIKKSGNDLWKTADIIAPGVAAGHAVGRIGCFFAGCCYGKQCDLPFAVKFTNPDSLAPLGVYLHPTQLYSVLSNLLLFCILLWIQKKKKFDGMVFLSYIMIYSLFRSFIEFFRGDFRGTFLFNNVSLSQGIGFVVFVIALIIILGKSGIVYGRKTK